MINNLKPDISARRTERGPTGAQGSGIGKPGASAKSGGTDFADQLFGARNGGNEGLDRNEPIQKPGREIGRKSDREGGGSIERESVPSKPTNLRAGSSEAKPVKKRAREEDDPVSQRTDGVSTSLPNPIVNEAKPRATDGSDAETVQELEGKSSARMTSAKSDVVLPDFFSQTAIGPAAAAAKLAPPADGASERELDPATANLIESMQGEQTQVRTEAIETFVRRMQTEVGVPPQKILESFALMDEKALMAPPEESMKQFIENLELPTEKTAQATTLYRDLVATTGQAALSERLIGMDQGVSFDVLSRRDETLRKLDRTLTDMNDAFFRSEGATPDKAAEALERMNAEIDRLVRGDRGADGELEVQGALAAAGAGSVAGSSAGSTSTGSGGGSSSDSWKSQASEVAAKSGKDVRSIAAEQDGFTLGSSGDKVAELGGDQVASFSVPGQSSSQSSVVAGPSAMMLGRPQATSQEEQENVRELMRQAQVMLKRGGGEMSMELKPEGMGQVKLKVSVVDGNVNVQMLTESESAKSLLEKGLGELKANLASHQLKVDTLRVDVGQDIQKQMDQNSGQQNQQREQARQFAQDFMGSFRDDRQQFRDGLVGTPGLRGYGRAQRRAAMEPEPVVASQARKSDGAKRLNLVA